ncbi:MAG: 50S ribosomal protein L21 [Methylacidiphilales bacterium]|nr:50S ribosomal protein L21 [Candidatus Methylacidiphilales bacterium]
MQNPVIVQNAVIATGGRQYLVSVGTLLRVEKIDLPENQDVVFDKVLLLKNGDEVLIGSPHVQGAIVTGKIRSQGRAKKIEIIKFKRRKHYQRRAGHRQKYTEVAITAISKA